jgi:hypothetical protein
MVYFAEDMSRGGGMKTALKIILILSFPIWIIPFVICVTVYAIWDFVNFIVENHCTDPECKHCKESDGQHNYTV